MTTHPVAGTVVPAETAWDTAPGLLDGAKNLNLTPQQCGLAYWLGGVAQGTLLGRAATGHGPTEPTPAHMREPGPLRDALIMELGCRSVAETEATKVLAAYVAAAPGTAELEFFVTQTVDEARHAMVFRGHLLELGLAADELEKVIERVSADYTRDVVEPILDFALRTVRDENDFIGGVSVFTIVIEGVLAPAAELSERKWTLLDPAAGAIARGASIDEIRHLSVGSTIVRDHLRDRPEYRTRLMDVLDRGRRLWETIPDRKYVLEREELFQEGMHRQKALPGLEEYEVFPGRRLLDTTPEERYELAERWTDEMAESRFAYMGIDPAVMRIG